MVTAERLREVIHYDPSTGVFTWRTPTNHRVKNGEVAGCVDPKGYRKIGIDGRIYMEHRLAWLYATGEWPEHQIDHSNLDKADNRLANLRAATNSQNHGNRGPNINNTSGFKGVHWNKNGQKWVAQITISFQIKYLGCFDTPKAASLAYALAAKKLFGEFARHEKA